VLRVPLRLALTDTPDEADAAALDALPGGGRLWQDRLASKLLRLAAQGDAGPWAPYLQALPRHVPSALDAFDAIDGAVAAVEYPPAMARLREHPALMAAKWREISGRAPEAIGAASLEDFRWAHTVRRRRGGGRGWTRLGPECRKGP
jgi:hypothetical protein